jgi:hypothetical protein
VTSEGEDARAEHTDGDKCHVDESGTKPQAAVVPPVPPAQPRYLPERLLFHRLIRAYRQLPGSVVDQPFISRRGQVDYVLDLIFGAAERPAALEGRQYGPGAGSPSWCL